jgi:Glycosyltransferase
MKILFLSENYFPNVSGVPVVVKYLAEGLLKNGHQVAIATKAFKEEPLIDNINRVDVYRFKIEKNALHRYVGDVAGYINFVKNYKAEVNIVECSQCITTDVLLSHLHEISGKKIFHSHGFSGMELKPFAIKGDLVHTIGNTWNWIASKWYFAHTLKKAMPYFDASMCLSEVDSSREYLKQCVPNSQILDNAAQDMFFDNIVEYNKIEKYAHLENCKYVMCCANYTVVKNQKDMIEQYYKSEASKTCSLVCIGSFPTEYYRECEALVKQLEKTVGHRDVHLLHGVDRADLPSIMAEAYIYLVTSRYEQYSISIIEAMSQGLPFISMNTGNARVLPGGITINHIDDMHVEIDHLFNDSSIHKQYSIAGKEFAYKNCRIDAVVNHLEAIINSI